MPTPTADNMDDLGTRYGVSRDAVRTLADAVRAGGGRMAQFSHPDLGGMGQWSQGGMIQIGDMFNTGLKDRVARLCAELAGSVEADAGSPPPSAPGRGDWWPEDLGRPSASGTQGGMRYAVFPKAARLVLERDGTRTVYDTGSHAITGVSQSQGDSWSLTFTSQDGPVRLEDLPVVTGA